MKKKKGFTLVELLVVIAIIALLMGILMPALAKVRQIAYRLVCGTNISGIGKAMMVYAQDNEEDYPVTGGRDAEWSSSGTLDNWDVTTGYSDVFDDEATIGSCFYLLVKYADVTPKQFICKGDVGAEEFQLSEYESGLNPEVDELTDVWDFGPDRTGDHYSYAYAQPFRRSDISGPGVVSNAARPIRSSSNPAAVVAADRNPFLDLNAVSYIFSSEVENPQWVSDSSGSYFDDRENKWNCASHQREGQNVLYADIHTSFEKTPCVGIENDNIYKPWPNVPALGTKPDAETRQLGNVGTKLSVGDASGPAQQDEDAYVVNEMQDQG